VVGLGFWFRAGVRERDFMAMSRVVQLVDDLDGGPADQTVQFGLDGAGYELDLSAANAAALRAVLSPYVSAGRRVSDAVRSKTVGRPGRRSVEAAPQLVAVEEPVEEPVAVVDEQPGEVVPEVDEPERPVVISVAFSDQHAHGTANG
jgi:hypothetical protein